MKIIRGDGSTVEAVLLVRTESTIRAVLEGDEDVTEFFNVHGTWVSEKREQVRIEFAWEGKPCRIVPPELIVSAPTSFAAQLMELLKSERKPPPVDAVLDLNGYSFAPRASALLN